MEDQIRNATSVHQINLILKEWAGQYDLDIVILAKEGVGIKATRGLVETPLKQGSVIEYTGHDVYAIESSKNIEEVKDVVIQSIKYRNLFTIVDTTN